jgi:HEAT repeat protein
VWIVISSILLLQITSPTQAKDLLQKLRSDNESEREEATRKIKELGTILIPELEIASRDKDLDYSLRARNLLRVIRLRSKLTENILATIPDIGDRLSSDDPHDWTVLFLQSVNNEVRPFANLQRDDLALLSVVAIKGVKSANEKEQICQAAARWHLDRLVFDIGKLLDDDNVIVRTAAIESLSTFKLSQSVSRITELLRDKKGVVRATAARALGHLDAREAVPAIALLLREDGIEAGAAALALADLNAQSLVPEIVKILKYNCSMARWAGAEALGALRAIEAEQELLQLLNDKNEVVRQFSIRAIGRLGLKSSIPKIGRLLDDPSGEIRVISLETLGRLKAASELPQLVEHAQTKALRERIASVDAIAALDETVGTRPLEGFLEGTDIELVARAASHLCRRGMTKAVPCVLKDGRYLTSLNAIRNRDAWERLTTCRMEEHSRGTPRMITEKVLGGSKFAILWQNDNKEENMFSWKVRYQVLCRSTTGLDVLEWLQDRGEACAVIEPDSISILPRQDALAFWNKWWTESKEKYK